MMHCAECENEFKLEGELMPCPKCGSMNLKVLSGREFMLDSIEIER